ncbi:ParB N-terminal domain-containing protein [Rhizobium lentis]|uniref:ParB N-terminal domain-containing protein n=1 Tax=Rhizobium lentis TaxID=1138194 RepID=UPI001C83AE0A|nr:ParB N-terminal domain-containing protein [Rhizobium lentis]MBX5082142.1 ParB N-terminal domain-containing protein [Rhizobium lentis]MBX5094852.1 ParB N-terminal domain-containing protein [Rhizobium lentis]MBX5119577.1 ParB N-terminal domain-containing protein [Rhizobium lentis]
MGEYRKIDISRIDRPEDVDPGPAPMLQWLKIDALVVDDSYQRALSGANWNAIRRIAANFRWSMFSPVFVAPIEGGAYAIIDGQHRTHAAAICGFSEVPCQIVQMNREEQAAAFAAVNGVVTKVTHWHLFKAALASGEEWATEAAAIAREAGCELMTNNASHWTKKPGHIYGVKAFRSLIAARPRESVIATLRFLMSCEGWRDDAAYWDAGLVMPVAAGLSKRASVFAHPGFRTAFEEFDIWELVDRDKKDRRGRIARGHSYQPKSETIPAAIIGWIDAKFPTTAAAE